MVEIAEYFIQFGLPGVAFCVAVLVTVLGLVAYISKQRRKIVSMEEELAVSKVTIANFNSEKELLESYKDVTEDQGRNIADFREKLQSSTDALDAATRSNDYLHDFAQRFRHDCGDRIKIVNVALDSVADEVERERARRQLAFLQEAANVQLAPSICGYVQAHVSSAQNRFSLNRRLSELVDTVRDRDPDDRIELDNQDEIHLWGKWQHIELLMINLLGNAIDHGDEGGAIQITVKKEDAMAVIEVYNDGAHIESHRIQRLFKLGETSKAQTTQQKSGYGLFFVNEVALGYGGDVAVKNTERTRGVIKRTTTGVRFIIRLPAICDEVVS